MTEGDIKYRVTQATMTPPFPRPLCTHAEWADPKGAAFPIPAHQTEGYKNSSDVTSDAGAALESPE